MIIFRGYHECKDFDELRGPLNTHWNLSSLYIQWKAG
jgi:hypothetical protein